MTLRGSIPTYEGGCASAQGAPGHAAAGQPGKRSPAGVRRPGGAARARRRPVRPAHRHHLPGTAAARGSRPRRRRLGRGRRAGAPPLPAHPAAGASAMTSPLITGYVAGLRRDLPARMADEAASGLLDTYEQHLAAGAGEHEAARDAVADFGDLATVVGEFTRQAPG